MLNPLIYKSDHHEPKLVGGQLQYVTLKTMVHFYWKFDLNLLLLEYTM